MTLTLQPPLAVLGVSFLQGISLRTESPQASPSDLALLRSKFT